MSKEIQVSTFAKLLAQMAPDETPSTVDSGDPKMHYAELMNGDTLESGVWSATAGGFTVDSYSVDEVMLMLSGKMRLTAVDGTVTELSEGDVFYIPKGWQGRWDTIEDMQKFYVIVY